MIGVILLYLMGTQLAAALQMTAATGSTLSFDDCLVVGLPLMMALLFSYIPMQVVPSILRPIIGNGFVMGVITVIILEHLVFRARGGNTK